MRARFVHLRGLRLMALATVLALTVAGSMTFIAAGQEPPVTYYACLKNGNLSKVGTSAPDNCPGNGTVISWNEQGPQGLTGATGATGATGQRERLARKARPDRWEQLGPQGAAGPVGATGPQGPAGAGGVSGYQIVTASTASSVGATTQAMAANCPAGKMVVGGGGQPVCDSGNSGTSASDHAAREPADLRWDRLERAGGSIQTWARAPSGT